MMNPYNHLIPRLNGDEIEDRFDYYSRLVKRGVAGFIVFGGELESLRRYLMSLQGYAERPLIIASDLETGLGEQVRGGTRFPAPMAIAHALKGMDEVERLSILKKVYSAFATEALYAGINTILAPVLDINSNPNNPIIASRSAGEDPETVSFFGSAMIRVLKGWGLLSCGKHFPGHGDTDRDSHIDLPVIRKEMKEMEGFELIPFKKAIESGVDMMMLGHLSVPCMDGSGRPATISDKIISYLRNAMGFRGLIITDAMNMGGIGDYNEAEASLMALKAGVDLILHPSDPFKVADYIKSDGFEKKPPLLNLPEVPVSGKPDFDSHRRLSRELFSRSVRVEGNLDSLRNPFMIFITDEDLRNAEPFLKWSREVFGYERVMIIDGPEIGFNRIPDGDLVVTIFSEVRGWKGDKLSYFKDLLINLEKKVKIFISLGNPYLIQRMDSTRIYGYGTSEEAQSAMINLLSGVLL